MEKGENGDGRSGPPWMGTKGGLSPCLKLLPLYVSEPLYSDEGTSYQDHGLLVVQVNASPQLRMLLSNVALEFYCNLALVAIYHSTLQSLDNPPLFDEH